MKQARTKRSFGGRRKQRFIEVLADCGNAGVRLPRAATPGDGRAGRSRRWSGRWSASARASRRRAGGAPPTSAHRLWGADGTERQMTIGVFRMTPIEVTTWPDAWPPRTQRNPPGYALQTRALPGFPFICYVRNRKLAAI